MFIPSPIKSVQTFSIDLTGATTATATISSVTTANAHATWQGAGSSSADVHNRDAGRVALTNATTVTATQDAGHNANPTVVGSVIEFFPGFIKSVQAGTITINTAVATGTATISSVATGKSQMVYNGYSGNVGDATTHGQATNYMQLTNATTATLTMGLAQSGGLAITGAFTNVEFH